MSLKRYLMPDEKQSRTEPTCPDQFCSCLASGLAESSRSISESIEECDQEKKKHQLFQDALLQLLKEACEESIKLQDIQKANLNAFEGMTIEQEKSHKNQIALMNILEDTAEDHKKLAIAYGQLRELQEKMLRQEKLTALGNLGGTIAHELRNPLGAIKNSIYFLRMKIPQALNDTKVKQHFDIIDEEVAISDRIITGILNFARMKEAQLVEVESHSVIDDALARVCIPENIKVTVDFKKDVPKVLADRGQLIQVFYNLILNAVQSMLDGGTLSISGSQVDKFLEIVVSDTGEGISKENLTKLFELLHSTKIYGSGLGLNVCQNIIAMHKGSIAVESELGKGTKFIVKIPIACKET